MSATVGLFGGFAAWFTRGRPEHVLFGRVFSVGMSIGALTVPPMMSVRQDDVLLATVPVLLWLIWAGARREASWSTTAGARRVALASSFVGLALVLLAPVRVMLGGGPDAWLWVAFGASLWALAWAEWRAPADMTPRFNRRVHGATMIVAMILAGQSLSPENLGPTVTAIVSAETLKLLPLGLGVPALALHLAQVRLGEGRAAAMVVAQGRATTP